MEHSKHQSSAAVRLSETVVANVRAELARTGMKTADIAPHLGLTARQVHRKMAGESMFSIDELGIIALAVGLEDKDGNPDPSEFFRVSRAARLHAVA